MILVDTSVWIDHFHSPDKNLISLLEKQEVLVHPFVIGELSLGHLKHRDQILRDLQLLSRIPPAPDSEVLGWVEKQRLFGKGINWVDAHLLLSCLLNGSEFWTRDKILLVTGRTTGVKAHSGR